jgi:uncharacterized membrane protein YcaP (DUF421 family)
MREGSVMNIDWAGMFIPTTSLIEVILRGTLMYLGLFVLLRVVPTRQIGSVGMADLLVIVLIADVSQNAFAADYRSLTEGFLLVATILFWNYVIDLLGYSSERLERYIEQPRLTLIDDGEILRDNMHKEKISHAELMSQLRQHGIDAPASVKLASIEPNGRISVVRREGAEDGSAAPSPG